MEEDKWTIAQFQIKQRLIRIQGFHLLMFWMDDDRFDLIMMRVQGTRFKDVFLQMANRLIVTRPRMFLQAGFVFAHPPGDFRNRVIDGCVQVVQRLTAGLNRQVVSAIQDDFTLLTMVVGVENEKRLCFNDPWIIQWKALNLFRDVVAEWLGDFQVAAGHGNRHVDVMCLHFGRLVWEGR